MNYIFYEKIYTKDDMYFYNKKAIPDCLAINSYLKYKNDDDYLNKLYETMPSKEVKEIKNIYLFIFNRGVKSGGNFYHFIYHYLQKLLGYFELKDISIGIPVNMLPFQKDILYKLIHNKVIPLDIYRYNYKITNCYVGKYLSASILPNLLFKKYQSLYRNNLFTKNENVICILRKKTNNAGKNRLMKNQKDFENYLQKFKTKFFYFEDYNFDEKVKNFLNLNPKIVIIEVGSGLANLLFINKNLLRNIKFIIIDQDEWNIDKSRISQIFKLLDINYEIFRCKTIYKNYENDSKNNPFTIDINEFHQKYNNLF